VTPETFIDKWRASTLKERSGSQSHFIDLCGLLGVESPTDFMGRRKLAFEKPERKRLCRFLIISR